MVSNPRTIAAMDYAARGFAVVPLYGVVDGVCECREREACPNPGKHPRIKEWQKNATDDESTITNWCGRYPEMNVGVQLGQKSGFIDIECDDAEAEKEIHPLFGGEIPFTPTYQSRRGKHRLFRWRDDLPFPDKAGFKIGNLEFRTGNGKKGQQSVFPPSRRADGAGYTWLISLDDAEPAEIDNATLERIQQKLKGKAAAKQEKKTTPRSNLFTECGQAEGGRDHALYGQAVAAWGDMVRARGAKVLEDDTVYSEVLTHLEGINATKCSPPLESAVVRAKCDSARAFHRAKAVELADFDPAADGQRWTSIRHDEGRTEAAFSRRFLTAYGDNVLWVPPWKTWLVWDGCRWKIDEGGCGVMRMAQAVSDAIWHEVAGYHTDDSIGYADDMSNPSRWTAALKSAAAFKAVSVADLNTNRWLLNCPNGTVDLRTGELRAHRKEDLLTTLCPTEFDPHAESYCWDRFLDGAVTIQPMQDYPQRLCGYALAGRVEKPEEILPVFWGDGSNGKSVFIGEVQETLGSDFTTSAAHGLLTEKTNDRHSTERASLYGKRFVFCSETGRGAALDEDLVKAMTGGDHIKARFCHKDEFEFKPTFTIFMITNHRPRVRGTDNGIWRRLNLFPWQQRFWCEWKGETGPEELKADAGLRDKLAKQRSGILAWLVRGCLEWQRIGLNSPNEVRVATAEYRTAEDIVGQFVSQCCITMPQVRVRFNDLYARFEQWCEANGEFAPKGRTVGSWLQEHGYTAVTSNGRWYVGIALEA